MSPNVDTERQLRELSFLHEVAQLASSARDWDEMLRIVIDRTTVAMAVEVSSLYLLERRDGILRLIATNGLNRRFIGKATLRVGEGITGWVANARVPAAARSVRADPRFKWIPGVDEERFTSMLSVPLLIHEEIVGVVNVQSVTERAWDKDEIEFLQTIANQVAGIIEKGRLQREAERKLREVSALFEVSNVLTSTLELDEVLSLIVDRLVRVYPGSAGIIVLRDGDGLRERARSGDSGKTTTQAARQAVAEARPIVSAHHIAVPLLAGERLLGAVALKIPEGTEMMEAEEVRFVSALANQAALAIDKASLYAVERETTASLRELERARSEFVAVVTHDLRTPLSVIRGYLDLLAEKNGHSTVPINEAVLQVGKLDELVDRILAGVRSDRPDLPQRRTRFDLRAAVTATLSELAPVARRHVLSAPRTGTPIWVRGDRRRVSDVLAGLVHNATKYAPSKTRIAVRLEKRADRAIVRVSDEGPGVPPNERPRMFEPYARGDHNDVPGTGIGLFSSRRVIEAQGGDIWYEESAGGGATFAFSVPAAREAKA